MSLSLQTPKLWLFLGKSDTQTPSLFLFKIRPFYSPIQLSQYESQAWNFPDCFLYGLFVLFPLFFSSITFSFYPVLIWSLEVPIGFYLLNEMDSPFYWIGRVASFVRLLSLFSPFSLCSFSLFFLFLFLLLLPVFRVHCESSILKKSCLISLRMRWMLLLEKG